MTWLLPKALTDGQAFWVCYAVAAVMAVTGGLMARSLWRRHQKLLRSMRAHPAGRPPYDWAREDCRLRQAVTVRRAS